MKVFELKDNKNQTTELFKIEEFTNVKDVIKQLNKYFNIEVEDDSDSLYTDDKEGCFNYVYVAGDGFCRFVEDLKEFNEGFQSEEEWKVNSSVEIN